MAPTASFLPLAAQIDITLPSLVIGSLSTAQSGHYQAVLKKLGSHVEKQMIDRILDGAAILRPSHYAVAHVILDTSDYNSLSGQISTLLVTLLQSLVPLGTLHITNSSAELLSELKLVGFIIISSAPDLLISQKPGGTSPSLLKKQTPGSVQLPRRNKNSAKKAIWTLNGPSTPIIDPDSLLTPEDLARPVPTCEPAVAGAPRRKKACKNCSCGLAEIEQEELRLGKVVVLDGAESGETKELGFDERERLKNAAKAASKATSSCGSCFLGDAFRCASCPYLGLPAFEPGQKVEIDFGMDDL